MFRRTDGHRGGSGPLFATVTRYRKIFAGILLTTAIAAAATIMLLPRLLDLNSYQSRIISLAQNALNRQVAYESATFSWHFGPALTFRKLVIKDIDGKTSLLEADRLSFTLAVLPLLHKELRLRDLVLERPLLQLDRNVTGVFNIADLFSGEPGEFKVHLHALRVTNGVVRFTDRYGHSEVRTVVLENLELSVRNPNRGEQAELTLSTSLATDASRARLDITGTAAIPAADKPLSAMAVDLAITAKNLDVGHCWPFYGGYLPITRLSGELELDGKYKGTLTEFTSTGRLQFKRLQLDYPRAFPAPLSPGKVTLSYQVELTPQKLTARTIDLFIDGFRIRGNCSLSDIRSTDPLISAHASTSQFRLEEINNYIPYGIIPATTAEFIQQHINGGVFQFNEVRLNGRLSQLRQPGQGDNYKALSVHALVEKGVMTAGPGIPIISGISGTLELSGKDFVLRGMRGRFGSSPFTLDGKVAGFSLDSPTSYPFTMTMEPAQTEVAWLLRQDKLQQFAFSGQSSLSLAGDGSADNYRLTGSWDLTGTDYQFRQLVHKPARLSNRLSFSAYFGEAAASISNVRYELPDLSVTANATYRYADNDRQSLMFAATTNRFVVKPNLPVFPVLLDYQPAGTLQATISGGGDPVSDDTLGLQGAVTCTDFSVRPFAQLPALSGINGTIHFTDTTLETTRLTGRLGNSPLTITGSLAGFDDPRVDLVFSSPGLHLQDLGFQSPGEELTVQKLAGRLTLRNDNLTIAALSGELLQSKFSLTGEVLDIRKPQISLDVDFPVLRVEDLLPLTRLTRGDKASGQPGVESLKARVTVGRGAVRNLSFEKFRTDLTLENNQLAVHSGTVGVFGGTVTGSGKADFSTNGGPRYAARYRLAHVNAEDLLQAAGLQRLTTGTLAGVGELRARGKTREELKASAKMSAELTLVNGLINLPTEASQRDGGGFPFQKIKSNLSFSNNMLALQSTRIDAFDGLITGAGRVDFNNPQDAGYELAVQFENIDAAPFFQAAGVPQISSGRLSLTSSLSARGGSLDALQSSARGFAELTLADGMLLLPTVSTRSNAGRFPFKTIKSRLAIDRQVLAMESARIDAFGGVMTGSGVADFSRPGYQLRIQMVAIDAVPLSQTMGVRRELSGRLTLRGELTATGDSAAELKKTVHGPVELHFEKGVIYKLPLVSKIFSLLNVSQLLDFRLPDLLSEGMPYDRIDGNFAFRDGSVATSDLSVHSKSINMTLVGKADLVNQDIDATIGVQPLQTAGRIISRIPVIGWLLTGKSRDVLVVYYTAKGPWADPKVTSTSTAALSKGVVDIFKRIYNLPEELITDPGQVILGN